MILALDIGGTKLSAALVYNNQIVERHETLTPTEDRGPESVTGAAIHLLRPLLPKATALGVAATGSVKNGCVTALNSDTLQGWHSFNLQNALENQTGLKTIVLNDADAAAWGEASAGAGRGVPDFIFVTVSTGVGGGLVLANNLYLTPGGQHAELGYTLTESGEPIELVAGGAALDKWAVLHGLANTRELVASANAGDAASEAELQRSAKLVALKLADLHLMLGISLAVVGGGLGLATNYLARVRAVLNGFGLPWSGLKILPAQLGVDAGLIGAANWAERVLDS